MSRLAAVRPEDATPEQKEVLDAITGGDRGQDRPLETFLDERGGLAGPFNAWMHHPELGGIAQQLGGQLRFHGVLPGAVRELAILTVGAKWMAEYEWWAHAKIGRREGVSDKTIETIRCGDRPSLSDPVQRAVYDFTLALLGTGKVEQTIYDAAHKQIGDNGLVELVTLVGYYTTISFMLNVFEVRLPEGEPCAFEGRR